MSLRTQILHGAIHHLPTHSFTRPALILALSQLRPEVSDPEGVIDTLFGPGGVAPVRALVESWEEEGKAVMKGEGEGKGKKGLERVLGRRLQWSAGVGEHLVEAYANLATPQTTHSIPLPLTALQTILSSLPSLPPAYAPPHAPQRPLISKPLFPQFSTSSLPIIRANPFGPLAYAWRIADEALYLTEDQLATTKAKQSDVKRGYWDEPVGPGPEWYGHRLGLGLVYLAAAYPAGLGPTPGSSNPHLPAALASLRKNLGRYEELAKSIENTEQNLGDAMGFVDYVARSWQGLIKSRYW
ncbi:hypothetical protein I305_02157 [Cryptococcus gattii E566]|uniref:COQ9 domain-containing protein n=2 Tax=Cryptococcus gattii TaxID=37769 RepID=E6RDE1_CRYGW|nr:Hypothetical protein CGB_K1460C [Cryptococcus gattii WM276]ADV24861.1 Hypothetical protein CGB_K1460C [Cryptococcus gattii WM276]KIR79318.1 hypothetical protein I306_03737 [Cryptococcus gattii EJB2]KIY35251.1 hypothetical protein I305_02157 [Cryptococcus gattii E566]KJE05715.1 hypothetical protein I311_00440 [Cryptococcus gattii NT-10]